MITYKLRLNYKDDFIVRGWFINPYDDEIYLKIGNQDFVKMDLTDESIDISSYLNSVEFNFTYDDDDNKTIKPLANINLMEENQRLDLSYEDMLTILDGTETFRYIYVPYVSGIFRKADYTNLFYTVTDEAGVTSELVDLTKPFLRVDNFSDYFIAYILDVLTKEDNITDDLLFKMNLHVREQGNRVLKIGGGTL